MEKYNLNKNIIKYDTMSHENINDDVKIQNKLRPGVEGTLELLSLWELPQLRDTFKEHEICTRALKFLSEAEIVSLIPKIGPRTIFTRMLNEWRQLLDESSRDLVSSIKREIDVQDINWLNVEKDNCKESMDWMQQHHCNEDPLRLNFDEATTANSIKYTMIKVDEGEQMGENVDKMSLSLDIDTQNKKRSRKSVTLATKIDVIRRIEAGEKIVQICNALGLAKSTVQTIRNRKEEIKTHLLSAAPLSVSNLTRQRSSIMEKMEQLLEMWIEGNNQRCIPMSQMIIQEKAKSIFEQLKTESTSESEKDVTFQGSRGWFEKFKKRHNLHGLTMTWRRRTASKKSKITLN